MPSEQNDTSFLIAELRDAIAELRAIVCHVQATARSSTDLITHAIDRLTLDGCKSQIMRLDRELIYQVAERLLQPGAQVKQTIDWLCGKLGREVSRMALYRFRESFVAAYERVTSSGRPAELADVATTAAERLKRTSRNKLLAEIPDDLLIELARMVGSHRSAELRGWLERRLDRKINPMQFGRLYLGLEGKLRAARKP